MEVTLTLAFCS